MGGAAGEKTGGPVAEVVVDVAALGIDRPLDYEIPPELLCRLAVGHRVLVPLRGRTVEGFVIGRRASSEHGKLRQISSLVDERPAFGVEAVELAEWLSQRFLFLRVDALRCLLPPHSRLRLRRRARTRLPIGYALASLPEIERQALLAEKRRRAPAQYRLLALLVDDPDKVWGREALLRASGVSDSVLRSLVAQGVVVREEGWAGAPRGEGLQPGQAGVSPARAGEQSPTALAGRLVLTEGQRRALSVITARLTDPGPPQPVLLQGVTGSGKTEVYMQAAAQVLAAGHQALVLVPEIALTPQAVSRFRARFGEQVALLHSRLAPGERVDEWWRIRRGEAPLVVGTRSAVFAPLDRLRLVVMDEEHEPSYKQEETPRYHARDVAWQRARRSGALFVLGSATPAIETYYRACSGELTTVALPDRVHGRPLPPMELVDMRHELKAGNRSILSRRLKDELARVIARGEQAMLFLNRRGYSSFVLCRECGKVLHCPACAVSLTYHAEGDRLRCHYCDWSQLLPRRCPTCQSDLLRRFGAGTQRVEEAVKAAFGDVSIARMDVDTTRRKGATERILAAFHNRETQILIGTQMIAKGHDFPGVSLVGAIAADSGLHLPDFRAAERTFQLLTQVAGRAGRADVEGRVLVQTYNPDHYSIRMAQAYDYPGFFEHEARFRRAGGYPPYKHLARILLSGHEGEAVREAARAMRRRVDSHLFSLGVDVLGPAPAPLRRLQSRYRWHLLIKGDAAERVREAASALREVAATSLPHEVAFAVDIDPTSVL